MSARGAITSREAAGVPCSPTLPEQGHYIDVLFPPYLCPFSFLPGELSFPEPPGLSPIFQCVSLTLIFFILHWSTDN